MELISSKLGITIAVCVMSYQFIEMVFSFFFIPIFFKTGIIVYRNILNEYVNISGFEMNKVHKLENCNFKIINNNELLFLKKLNLLNEKSFFTPLRGTIKFNNSKVITNFRFPLGLILILLWGLVVVFLIAPQILGDLLKPNPNPQVFFPIFGIVVPPIMIYIDYRITKGKIDELSQEIIQFLKKSNR